MNADLRVLVVGGGPAGATAALQARELGAQVTLLEAAQIGGTTLNRGPAPVRTLARAARLARDWSSWATFGLDGPPPVPNLPAMLIADRASHTILGGHVLGEYSAETVQTVAACMAAGMTVEQIAELQFAYPTFTEGVSMAAQKICRKLGIGQFPRVWSYLGADE